MPSVAELLQLEITYDIIIGDFGREATVEFLRLLAERERLLIQSIVQSEGRPFFDEYRRIMFTVVDDVAHFKRDEIADIAKRYGYLTEDVLIGLGPTPMSEAFVMRVAACVIHELVLAFDRGYRRFRIVIPCNRLSDVAVRVGEIVRSVNALAEIGLHDVGNIAALLETASVTVHTVPEAVLNRVSSGRAVEPVPVLLLGTESTRAVYASFADPTSIELLPIGGQEQELIDTTVVAAIGGSVADVSEYGKHLVAGVIEPRRIITPGMVVVEACTDFSLGLGLNSLVVFVESLILDCYGQLR